MAPSTARKTRPQRADAKRAEILAGGRAEFLAQGYEGASMDAVAATAGVSKMTVYRHFGSKEQLFSGVIRQLCDDIIDDDIAEQMDTVPVAAALRMFARRMLATIYDPETLQLHRVVIAESGRFPALGKLFYEQGPLRSMGLLAVFIKRHPQHFGTKSKNSERAAMEFMSLLRGYTHLKALLGQKPSSAEIKAAVDGALSFLLDRPR